jgi:hypothetical protein
VDVQVAEAKINVAMNQMHLFLKQAEINVGIGSDVSCAWRPRGRRPIALSWLPGCSPGFPCRPMSAPGRCKSYTGSEGSSETHPHKELDP